MGIKIELVYNDIVNYAVQQQQNRTPVLKTLILTNSGQESYENLMLNISSKPEDLFVPCTLPIDRLDADSSLDLSQEVRLLLNPEYLAKLTERIAGALEVSLTCGENELIREARPINALAFNEWNGQAGLLPAFVTPSNAELAPLLHRVVEILREKYPTRSFDGFEGYSVNDINLIKQMVAAIFQSIWENKFVYSALPPSFEKIGQKVRMVNTIFSEGFANCLDFTLLMASALEAIKLHPILIGVPGHIFCGVWLEEKTFSSVTTKDVNELLSRIGEGNQQLLVFECTRMCDGTSSPDFDSAIDSAVEQLRTKVMQYCVDVQAARDIGVLPMPEVQEVDGKFQLKLPKQKVDAASSDKIVTFEDDSKPREYDKMGMWIASLLNAGDLRNPLLNQRFSGKTLPLFADNLPKLIQAVSTGESFTVHPIEEAPQINDFSELAALENPTLFASDLTNNRLRTVLGERELAKILRTIYTQRNTAIEQTGSNTLYLSLGHLKWADKKAPKKPLYAPIILVPMDVEYKSNIYRFHLREDEITLNATIIERLRADLRLDMPTWDQLPVDENDAVDVRKILAIVRKAVAEQSGWMVEETATITHFSFAKFNMWRDLSENSELIGSHRMIKSLLEGKLCWEADHDTFTTELPKNTFVIPLSVDGSQMFAIEKALEGHSFVLHGAPGTGKSQTISAIIAAAIASGKKVLLISEKPVALSVPEERLESIGLGPFCLEIHSDKGQMQQILKKYSDLIDMANSPIDPQKRQIQESTDREFAAKSERYLELREELDQYLNALHSPRANGSTLHSMIGHYTELPDGVYFPDEALCDEIDPRLHTQQEELMASLIALQNEIGDPAERPLLRTGLKELTYDETEYIRIILTQYKTALTELKNTDTTFSNTYKLNAGFDSVSIKEHFDKATLLESWSNFPKEWTDGDIDEIKEPMNSLAVALSTEERNKNILSSAWEPAFLEADGITLAKEYNDLDTNPLLKPFKWASLSNKLSKLRLKEVRKWKLTINQAADAITKLCEYQKARRKATEILSSNPVLEKYLAEDSRNSSAVYRQMEALEDCQNQLGGLCEAFAACGSEKEPIENMLKAWQKILNLRNLLDSALKREISADDWNLEAEISVTEAMLCDLGSVKELNAFHRACAKAQELGLEPAIQKMREGYDAASVMAGFRKSTCRKTICDIISLDPALNQFTGLEFNQKIEAFRQLDESLIPLIRARIRNSLEERATRAINSAAHSGNELTVLNKAIASQGKNTSVRKLFAAAKPLLLELTPCLMMSPLSVSKYLSMELDMFDLVIFDEASQMNTSDAIGCIARGKNCIICGDPKQMPPTSFFTSGTLVDEETAELQDMESILDDCLALNMPGTHLKWHYRSHHESLISFSNNYFYDRKLLTFPSAADKNSHVHLKLVTDGCFDWGKSKCNAPEADAVIEQLRAMSQNPDYSDKSVAVITSNINQQAMIEDKLMAARKDDLILSEWLDKSEDSILIQNLENIQGHERDVVMFSLGYGPDSTGKIIQNFGPLNRDGGWRRFNVAITRACDEFIIFSSIHPDQIKISPTTSRGVIALQQFLRYAATGELTTFRSQTGSSESGVAEDIIKSLKDAGYDAVENLGHSQLRVDIAVIDPEHPDQFLLGILLDGSSYSFAKSTRDRELGHIEVLTALGWDLMRVWSVDYWDNRGSNKQITQILNKLEYLKQKKQAACATE